MTTRRSSHWYGGTGRNAYIHRAWMRRGLPDSAFDGRPHIAIANTASDLTPCNAHLDEVAASVKEGVWAAGGVPLNLPVVSLGETQVRPTAMLWRNMAAMAIEEMLLVHRYWRGAAPASRPLPSLVGSERFGADDALTVRDTGASRG